MNTLRNLAALALLAFAALSPAHAEDAAQANDGGGSEARLNDVRKALKENPEIAALVGGGQEEAIGALKKQLSERGVKDAQDIAALAGGGDEKAIADALQQELTKRGVKDDEALEALAGDSPEKAIDAALKKYVSDHPEAQDDAEALARDGKALAAALKARLK